VSKLPEVKIYTDYEHRLRIALFKIRDANRAPTNSQIDRLANAALDWTPAGSPNEKE
jgi:hypothetical protein